MRAVTGKVALGQADAGFVYVTDARAVSDQVTVIRIPAWAQPRVRYEIAVVARSSNKAAAQAWIKTLLSAEGQTALKNSGFLPLPKSRRRRRRALPRDARRSRRASPSLFLLLPDRRDLPARPAGRARLARSGRDAARDALRVTAETNAIAMLADPPLRHARRVLDRDAPRRAPRPRSSRSSSSRSCCRRPSPDRPARRVRPARAARRHVRRARDRHRVHEDRRRARRHVRREPVLRPHGDRGVRGRRPDAAGRRADARRRPGRVFVRVALPLARGGLGAGAALAFARGIGEFGATIMFAGSLQGVTQTLSLAIYEQFDVDFDVALAISALLVVDQRGRPPLRQAR